MAARRGPTRRIREGPARPSLQIGLGAEARAWCGWLSRRQAVPAHDEIPDELLANIPVVPGEDTVFVPVEENPAASTTLAEQLRYDMGEAFARELDRAALRISAALADMTAQLARLHEQVGALQTENEELRASRAEIERKLNAFKDLALGR